MLQIFKLQQSVQEVIQEIHDTFNTEVDRLFDYAKNPGDVSTISQNLLNKSEKLSKLGFSSAKEFVEVEKESLRIGKIKKENEIKADLVKAIHHFKFYYPPYKFITEESVEKICKKYGLIYEKVRNYKGNVSDKNLQDIEKFKIREEDECYISNIKEYAECANKELLYENKYQETYELFHCQDYRKFFVKCSLEIASLFSDFNLINTEINDFKLSQIEVFDPVILQPVFFNKNKYYLILTPFNN